MSISPMRMIIRQADLDTIVTAYLLGADRKTNVRVVRETADFAELADPAIICIECGGSGQMSSNNFDHHDPQLLLPPACAQAMSVQTIDDEWLQRLVEYTSSVDTCGPTKEPIQSPSLSTLISGVRLLHSDQSECLQAGLTILQCSQIAKVNVYGPIPIGQNLAPYYDAAIKNRKRLQRDAKKALLFCTESGMRWGFLSSENHGVHGILRGQGCDISIAARQYGSETGLRRISIASSGRKLAPLLDQLNNMEPGWGGPGHGTIVGSPFAGTRLHDDEIFGLIENLLAN